MYYCPYCGTKVKDEELFCLNCGKKLPSDLSKRVDTSKQKFNRLWFLPISLGILLLIVTIGLFLLTEKQAEQALEYYEKSEQYILEGKYDLARDNLDKAIKLKPKFEQAIIAKEFIQIATIVSNNIDKAEGYLEEEQFQEALGLINESERILSPYHGEVTTDLIEQLHSERNSIKFASLLAALEKQPSIDELKILLWDAEEIKTVEAKEVAENIRNQIANYTYSKAVELLTKHQFSDAHLLVNDGLKYASNSEKLLSLQQTIDKEKEAYESELQKRIEQAIHLAEEERELNEMEAVELIDVDFEVDDQGALIVFGEIKSVATIPINSIIVKYALYTDNTEEPYLTNKAFVFPDILYPGDHGNFEFTHYDIDQKIDITRIQIEKFTWYTN